ncbi:hypothetical protein ASJ81_19170 [Methanosarcina spelaei]|uniref:Uncharacterized protein n=1 Tax=Methanosarcina spelaei TaxID=1036679 RepID=A0A2A2HUG8_9EURY|nr:hypothetical protein [Methanosarcina spelaei]PAV12958.1 hypothetical protein ASJ81_19170 [Methanosarcina spelaei]
MENISTELLEQFRKSKELERKIKENLAGLDSVPKSSDFCIFDRKSELARRIQFLSKSIFAI